MPHGWGWGWVIFNVHAHGDRAVAVDLQRPCPHVPQKGGVAVGSTKEPIPQRVKNPFPKSPFHETPFSKSSFHKSPFTKARSTKDTTRPSRIRGEVPFPFPPHLGQNLPTPGLSVRSGALPKNAEANSPNPCPEGARIPVTASGVPPPPPTLTPTLIPHRTHLLGEFGLSKLRVGDDQVLVEES